jgi:hypothetical protein
MAQIFSCTFQTNDIVSNFRVDCGSVPLTAFVTLTARSPLTEFCCSKLVYGKCWVRVPAWTLAIVTEIFGGFLEFLQANVLIGPGLEQGQFLPGPLNSLFIHHPAGRRCRVRVP